MNYYSLTLHEALQLLNSGETTSVSLTESVLARIQDVEGAVKAYISINEKQALEQAEHADSLRRAGKGGPLCGIPLAVKDVLCTTGFPTTCGSRMLENFVSPYDATVISKLQEAGAVLLGKLTMDEFAMGSTNENCAFHVPENPIRLSLILVKVCVTVPMCCCSFGPRYRRGLQNL